MTEGSQLRLWLMRGAFLLLTLAILFFQLLPLDTTPRSWAGPDLILAFAVAWSLRRPDYVPPLVLALAFLLADLLLQRPPGLWALLALAGCENLKSRARNLRDAGFGVEWFTVAVVLVMITAAHRIVLLLALIDVPRLSLTLSELGATLLFYPVAVGITRWPMGVRRAAPGDLDVLGQRA